MARRNVSQAFLLVVEPERDIARVIVRYLREASPALRRIRIKAFTKSASAWDYLCSEKAIEPCVAVTDTIGVIPGAKSFMGKLRRKFPKSRIILFSARATEEDIVRLQNEDLLIHRYVPKDAGYLRLAEVAGEEFAEYEREPVLLSMRLYLSRCRDPSAPFTAIGHKEYSLVDMYWEVVKETETGKMMEDVWRSLQVKAMLQDEHS